MRVDILINFDYLWIFHFMQPLCLADLGTIKGIYAQYVGFIFLGGIEI